MVGCLDDRLADCFHDDGDDHSNEGEADENVGGGGDKELGVTRKDVAETDGGQRGEGEVEGLEVGPVLPARVHQRTEENVEEGDQYGNDRRQVEIVIYVVGHVDIFHLLPRVLRAPLRQAHAQLLARRQLPPALVHALAEAASGVVEAPYKGPEELDRPCQRLAEFRENYEAERDPKKGVDHRHNSTEARLWNNVSIAYNKAIQDAGLSQLKERILILW